MELLTKLKSKKPTLEDIAKMFQGPQATNENIAMMVIEDMDRTRTFYPTGQQVQQLAAAIQRMRNNKVRFIDDDCEVLSNRKSIERYEWFEDVDGFDEADDILGEIYRSK